MLYKIVCVIKDQEDRGVSTPKLNRIMCNCTDLRHFPRSGLHRVAWAMSSRRFVMFCVNPEGPLVGPLLLSISLLSVRQPFSFFFDITVDSGIRFARRLFFPLHSISGGGCEITNAQGVGQDRRFGQTKRGLRGYFVCQR